MAADAPTSLLRPLVDDLHERRAQARARRRRGEDRPAARARQADRARAHRRCSSTRARSPSWASTRGIHYSVRGLEDKEAPADGVITGYGKVDGRLVAVAAYDFTVMAGSMGMTGEMKVARLRELALTKRMPFVWLLDTAGARIQEAVGSLFAGSGHLFREEVVASRRDPAGRRADGPVRRRHRLHPRASPTSCRWSRAAARWRSPARTSCAPRSARTSRRRSSAARACTAASPASATSRSAVRRGVHRRRSRTTCRSCPSHNREQRRRSVELRRPDRPRRTRSCSTSCRSPTASPTTCTRSSGGSSTTASYFDMKPQWAKTIITCFARFGGRPAGIVANQPKQLGGILDNDSRRQGRALREPLQRLRHPAASS